MTANQYRAVSVDEIIGAMSDERAARVEERASELARALDLAAMVEKVMKQFESALARRLS